ncbi:MAG: NAD(P)/FAD-dependent oxidoreductase [Oligoflexia bacterium]|nr:NAD(P)/FAD-dependent oxidoreductase [Oligoflexia bacterium]
MTEYKYIIVGGGAAGISLALNLLAEGENDFIILEKSSILGSSWDNMPDHLTLISSDHHNRILEENSPFSKLYRVPAKDFSKYLQEFQSQIKDKILFNQKVIGIERSTNSESSKWLTKTKERTFHSQNIIWCTGYFSTPYIPKFVVNNESTIHFKDFKNALEFRQKKILVVGKRLSAGQIIKELMEAQCNVHISTRSEIKFSPNKWIMNLLLYFLDPIEKFLLLFNKNLRVKEDIKMEASFAKKYFDEDSVTIHGDILEIDNHDVTFLNQESERFDKIILTTGFRPTPPPNISKVDFSQLKNHFEHPENPGFYFLGFEQQFNFRSRFLRGIRKDAKVLAKHLISSRK